MQAGFIVIIIISIFSSNQKKLKPPHQPLKISQVQGTCAYSVQWISCTGLASAIMELKLQTSYK